MKHTLLLCALLCGAACLPAQTFDFALSGGLTMGQIDGDHAGHYNHLGYHAGVASSFPLGGRRSHWRMAVEIGVVQKGAEINTGSVADRSVSLHYVHLPLLLTYAFPFGDDRSLRLGAGIAPALLFHAKVMDGSVENEEQERNFRRMDALPVCLDAILMFNEHIGLSARYYNSMLNIAKESGEGTYRISRSNKGVFNNMLAFGLLYRF